LAASTHAHAAPLASFDNVKPGMLNVKLAEGNYNVTVTLGDARLATTTTIKAELRRLMLESVHTQPGQFVTRTFTVNVRSPNIAAVGPIAAGRVDLKVPRETVQEAIAWDDQLTLEINGANPVRHIEISAVSTPTLFLLGDSTVCDQPGEPYSSWGQMLPRFFNAGIAMANHGESGETYRDSIARRRLDKILSVMKPGDTVLMQFGHNDQKQIKAGNGSPFTTYKAEIKTHVDGVRARGGVPVLVSSMERRAFDANGKVTPSLADYAEATRQSAQELGVTYIDLNALSKPFYEALGPEQSRVAFAEPSPGKIDNTHHNAYGSYELAKIIVTELRRAKLPVARFVAADVPMFDPAKPDPFSTFAVPPSPDTRADRPLGDEANASRAGSASQAYLFTYFTKNGEDGLHLAVSDDGYQWDKVGGGRSYLTPTVGKSKLLRDPSIVRGPDGVYHMVWTSGWNENNIGHASSRDLVTWSAQQELPVMAHEKAVLNAWAPEIVYDQKRSEYLIFWASTIPGRFPQTDGSSEEKYNHRIYATTTRDFASFTPTRLFYDPGFSVIDAAFLRGPNADYLMVKDETRTPPKKYLQIAAAPDLQGGFGKLGAPISKPGLWVEGPTALQVGVDTIIYYDAYTTKHYGALRSPDLVNWEDVTDMLHFPDEGTSLRVRHGTAIAIPAALAASLRASSPAAN
jgi:lysophospholipase L1-like esterase